MHSLVTDFALLLQSCNLNEPLDRNSGGRAGYRRQRPFEAMFREAVSGKTVQSSVSPSPVGGPGLASVLASFASVQFRDVRKAPGRATAPGHRQR